MTASGFLMKEGFERIQDTLQPVLLEKGFTKIEEKCYPEAFDSCYVIFQNAKEHIRLIWDGKEHWFLLQSTPDSSVTFTSEWTDILLQFFKPGQHRPETVDKIAEDLKTALLDYLGTGYMKSS